MPGFVPRMPTIVADCRRVGKEVADTNLHVVLIGAGIVGAVSALELPPDAHRVIGFAARLDRPIRQSGSLNSQSLQTNHLHRLARRNRRGMRGSQDQSVGSG